VAQRTHEIGVRVALVASRGDVLSMIVRTGGRLVGTGLLAGTLVSLAITRVNGIASATVLSCAAAAEVI